MFQRPMHRRQLLASAGAAAVSGMAMAAGAVAQDGGDNTLETIGIRINEGLLPDHRLLLYYGFPENPNMGILGQHEPAQLLELMRAQVAEYEAVDNSRPWKLGFELIASVAQGSPQEDNSYIADTSGDWLDLYTGFAAENDMVVVLDVQMGRKEPFDDYSGLERWLQFDHVHLAIDPEFKMWGDEVPGVDLGHVTSEHVIQAQEWLIDIGNKYGTSRKMLMVHQFHVYMIEDKDQIEPMAGVDLVINEDGWGPPDMKRDTYNVVITQQPIEYHGIKLFYDQDEPLMSAADIMALDPPPDVVNYQ